MCDKMVFKHWQKPYMVYEQSPRTFKKWNSQATFWKLNLLPNILLTNIHIAWIVCLRSPHTELVTVAQPRFWCDWQNLLKFVKIWLFATFTKFSKWALPKYGMYLQHLAKPACDWCDSKRLQRPPLPLMILFNIPEKISTSCFFKRPP